MEWKEICKISLFVDDMILYVENPKESIKILLEQIKLANLQDIIHIEFYMNSIQIHIEIYQQ